MHHSVFLPFFPLFSWTSVVLCTDPLPLPDSQLSPIQHRCSRATAGACAGIGQAGGVFGERGQLSLTLNIAPACLMGLLVSGAAI